MLTSKIMQTVSAKRVPLGQLPAYFAVLSLKQEFHSLNSPISPHCLPLQVQHKELKGGLRKANEESESDIVSQSSFWAAAWVPWSKVGWWTVGCLQASCAPHFISHQGMRQSHPNELEEQNVASKRKGKFWVSTEQPTGKVVSSVSWKNKLLYKESSYLPCNFQAVKSKPMILLPLKLKISSGKTLVWKQIELQAF